MSVCRSCAHWRSDRAGKDLGQCRAHPPIIVPGLAVLDAPDQGSAETNSAGIHFATRFPITSSSDGCGEWDSNVPL